MIFSRLIGKFSVKTGAKSGDSGFSVEPIENNAQQDIKPPRKFIDDFIDQLSNVKRHEYGDSEWNVCLATDGVEILPFVRHEVWIDDSGDVIQIYKTKIVPIDSPATLKLNWFIENLAKDGFEKEAESLDTLTRTWRDSQVEMKMIYSSEPDYEFAISNCRFLLDPEYKR